jgi:hypothetical protein
MRSWSSLLNFSDSIFTSTSFPRRTTSCLEANLDLPKSNLCGSLFFSPRPNFRLSLGVVGFDGGRELVASDSASVTTSVEGPPIGDVALCSLSRRSSSLCTICSKSLRFDLGVSESVSVGYGSTTSCRLRSSSTRGEWDEWMCWVMIESIVFCISASNGRCGSSRAFASLSSTSLGIS